MGEKERLLLTSSKLESVILELFSDQSLCLWNMRLQIYPVHHQLHPDPSLRNDANNHHDLILIFFHGFSNDTDAWVKAWIQRDDHHVCCWPLKTGYRKRKKRRDWVTIFWWCLCPSTLIQVAHTRKSVKEPTAEPGERVRMSPMLPRPFCVFFCFFVLVKFNSRLDMTSCWHP